MSLTLPALLPLLAAGHYPRPHPLPPSHPARPCCRPLRSDVVIELLRDQEQLKRSDIVEAAKARGIGVSDALYSRVVKELCSSRGSIWTLKG